MTILSATTRTSFYKPILTMVIVLIMCLSVLAIYLHGPLQGRFSHFFLPAEKFGVPVELKAHGITELYTGQVQTGWDGQFYYYIANDLLAVNDTIQHIDSSAYRYQRIGLPFAAKLLSKMVGQAWVSPLIYYLTSLLLVMVASGAAAFFFQNRHLNPYLILFWALACGTQVTLLNGLPDAAADAFLILALISLIKRHYILYVLTVSFAALTREIYVLLPFFMMIVTVVEVMKTEGTSLKAVPTLFHKIWIHALPAIFFVGWQIVIRIKFGVSASSQATGVLGLPFVSAFQYMIAGFQNAHPVVGVGKMAYLEGSGITLYLILLMSSAISLIVLLVRAIKGELLYSEKSVAIATSLTFLSFVLVYFCFGPTVMMHHTGYFKATNIFLFVIPFVASLQQRKLSILMTCFLAFVTLFFDYFLWVRIASEPYHPTTTVKYVNTEPSCLTNYRAKLEVLRSEELLRDGIIQRFLVRRSAIMTIRITNLSHEPFSPFPGKGAVNLSYQWTKKMIPK